MASGIANPLSSVLTHARKLTEQLLPDPAVLPEDWEADKDALQQQLHPALFAVLSTGRSLPEGHRLADQHAADLWQIVCRLWNFCVGQHNARGKPESWLVTLRQFSRRACFPHSFAPCCDAIACCVCK